MSREASLALGILPIIAQGKSGMQLAPVFQKKRSGVTFVEHCGIWYHHMNFGRCGLYGTV